MDSFDHQSIKEIKVLSSLYNNENQINEELRNQFNLFQKEMKQRGISLEMRLASTKAEYEEISHDRFLIGQNIKYNVPSFTTVMKGRFSEIKKTNNDIPFEDYWNRKDCLDIIKDWSRIKHLLSIPRRIYYPAICRGIVSNRFIVTVLSELFIYVPLYILRLNTIFLSLS